MHSAPRTLRRAVAAATVALLATALGCAPQPEEKASTPASGSAAKSCVRGKLTTSTPGKLTIATDEPAYEPWFKDDKPASGKGFESAVAYAVAKRLGYSKDTVVWQSVPFNKAFAPGVKTFDFDINQCRSAPNARRPWTSPPATTTCARPSSRSRAARRPERRLSRT